MTEIRTRQRRVLRDHRIGNVEIEHVYIDKPATIETWIEHCGNLAAEFGMAALDIHNALFAQFPELFGGAG